MELKWYHLMGLLIILTGAFGPTTEYIPNSWQIPVVVIGVVVFFLNILWKILNIEVMMWVPLYKLLGMTSGVILILFGVVTLLCSSMSYSANNRDLTPVFISLALMLLGAIIVFAAEGLKLKMFEKEEKKKNK